MLGVALALVLTQAEPADAGSADAGVPGPAPAPAPLPFEPPPAPVAAAPTAHWALWTQPAGAVGYGIAGSLTNVGGLTTPVMAYVPLGANVVLPGFELVVELTVTGQLLGSFQPARVGAWLTVGPLFHTGAIPLNGFFVQPKLLGAYTTSLGVNFSCGSFCPQSDNVLVAMGVDVGYQFTFRRMYYAFVIGFGGGGGTYPDMSFVTPFQTNFGGGLPFAGTFNPVLLLNLNLLRVGGWN